MRQADRLADLVAYARTRSPWYRRQYQGLPDRVDDPALLPVTSKKILMPEFDDWVTDPAVTWERARRFAADPALTGQRFAGHYTLVTTSGTTGTPGIFVVDERALRVNVALAGKMRASWLGAAGAAKVLRGGPRIGMVVATGGHFLVAAGSERLFASPLTRNLVRAFSVHAPIAELVDELNRFRPSILIGYASVLSLLADEQESGRLGIDPVLVEPAGEGLTPAETRRMAAAFGAKVCATYGATECPFLTRGCAEGWFHVNTAWAILEPVDAEYRPVPAGEPSHTVLISNLANRVQPILRYDLGDSVVQRPGPCPCGDEAPAFRVAGRSASLLTFAKPGGATVRVSPLALNTAVDHLPGVGLFQVVQTARAELRIRLAVVSGFDGDAVWREVRESVGELLAGQGLDEVAVSRDAEPPRQSAGGKYLSVIPLEAAHVPS